MERAPERQVESAHSQRGRAMIDTLKTGENDPALRQPLSQEEPGSQAEEPSPDDDEENPIINAVVEEIDVTDGDDEDDGEAGDLAEDADVVGGDTPPSSGGTP